MGQRLNIEIKKKGRRLANCYYHWSGYTRTSLKLIQEILSNMYDYKDVEDDNRQAILLLETTGAGLIGSEYDTLPETEKKYHRIGTNRNKGLIAITDKEMNDIEEWEEARVTINLWGERPDNWQLLSGDSVESINFDVAYQYVSKEEILEYVDNVDFDNIVEFNFDLCNMSADDIKDLSENIECIENNGGVFKINDNYYGVIY